MAIDPTLLIGVDWGTTNLRVIRIGDGGAVLEHRSDGRGAGGLKSEAFGGVLQDVAGDWLTPDRPVLICGMAGARERWSETTYCPCPATLEDLAARLTPVSPLQRIVSGVCMTDDDGLADVMRGEETQAMGLVDEVRRGWLVTPGTHSKWIGLDDGRIARFRTFVTGELYAALRTGILGEGLGQAGADDAAFDAGVRKALVDPAVTAALFSVRVGRLAGRLPDTGAADYLSGLLIGAEVAAQGHDRDDPIVIIGEDALTRRYERALELAGFNQVRSEAGLNITARGLWRIHQASLT